MNHLHGQHGKPSDHNAFGAQWWEQHYQGRGTGSGAPSPQLVAELTGHPVGTALENTVFADVTPVRPSFGETTSMN